MASSCIQAVQGLPALSTQLIKTCYWTDLSSKENLLFLLQITFNFTVWIYQKVVASKETQENQHPPWVILHGSPSTDATALGQVTWCYLCLSCACAFLSISAWSRWTAVPAVPEEFTEKWSQTVSSPSDRFCSFLSNAVWKCG